MLDEVVPLYEITCQPCDENQRLSASDDFAVVGAYPPGPQMEITRPTPDNHRKALQTIPRLPFPMTDPVYGADGPLVELWKKRGK